MAAPLQIGSPRLGPECEPRPGQRKTLGVEVIYTSDEGTKQALRKAWSLARDLSARVRLVFVYPVSYTLPLGRPADSLPFLQGKLVKLASNFPGEASVHIILCREFFRSVQDTLPPNSLVVLGGRRRWWWPTKGEWMGKRLKKLGHHVIFVVSE